MTVRQQWLLVGAFLVAIGGALYGATHLFGGGEVTAGSRAPDFHATTIDSAHTPVTLADLRGQVVLLNIWATYCVPCRIEMPSIEQLQREMGPRGLRILDVSIDDPAQSDKIRQFVKQYGLTFEVLHDRSTRIASIYQTTGIPETFIIGRDGVIRKKMIGATDWNTDDNRALLAQLLAEPAS